MVIDRATLFTDRLERSYVGKLLNLTLLSPMTIEALVAGDEPDGLSVAIVRQGVPVRWDEQGA